MKYNKNLLTPKDLLKTSNNSKSLNEEKNSVICPDSKTNEEQNI
jgi:hypothetical protein